MSWQIDLSTWQTVGLIIDYSIKLIAIGFVPEGRRPSSSTAWLLAILLIPFLGLPLFLTMGSPYINKRRHDLQRKANKDIENVQAKVPDYPEGSVIGDELVSMIKMNRRLTSLPATTGYNLGVHSDYEASIQAMSDAVDQAQKIRSRADLHHGVGRHHRCFLPVACPCCTTRSESASPL